MGLLSFLFGGDKPQQPQPQQQPQMGGLLGNVQTGQSYRQYQMDMMSKGQTPLPMDQWVKAQQAAQAAAAAKK